jgi:hypothetical protein
MQTNCSTPRLLQNVLLVQRLATDVVMDYPWIVHRTVRPTQLDYLRLLQILCERDAQIARYTRSRGAERGKPCSKTAPII